MQAGIDSLPHMTDFENLETTMKAGFHVSVLPVHLTAPEEGLKDLLQMADDLLFVLDETGRIVNCKARAGSILHNFHVRKGLFIRDILPDTIKRKLEIATEQFNQSKRFTLFESMLTLPPSGINWYEFRLIPALENQVVLFVWNVKGYRDASRTVPNLPVSTEKTLEGWSRSLYLRDFETEDHTKRVTEMTLKLARRLGLPETEMANIRRGAQVHDIGKIAIPDAILLKTGELTKGEWDLMRRHPMLAVEFLRSIPDIEPALYIPRYHHEKWDGSGYPDHLAGEEIPLAARIFAFADVFDALTSDRPYRRAWSKEFALEFIQKESGRHFDPRLAPDFIQMLHGS